MKPLQLHEIAEHLESIEETIVFKLIDRAQYMVNGVVYERGKSGFEGNSDKSLFELRLLMQEEMDARFGRFCAPEERPFNSRLPASSRQVSIPNNGLFIEDYDLVNMTGEIMAAYRRLVDIICIAGDDGQYGSSVEHDVYALQAISRRIHYGGLYVAESKFGGDPDLYKKLIAAHDSEGLLLQLTRKEVEEKILERVREKSIAAQIKINTAIRRKIDPEAIVNFYYECIIPLTKKAEVRYILSRQSRISQLQ
jgi:chorismate mutase